MITCGAPELAFDPTEKEDDEEPYDDEVLRNLSFASMETCGVTRKR
jgi:hypothetical protein